MRYWLLYFFTVLVMCLNAQDDDREFTLLPALGLNGCQVHGDSYDGFHKLGAFAGIAVNAKTGSRTSLQLGFYFSQKGARHNPNPKGDLSYYRLNLNYIDLPLSLRFFANENYFLTAGPSIAYLFSWNENINYADVTGNYQFRHFEVGLNVGIGRKLPKGFYVEVRSSNSIAPIRTYGMNAQLYNVNVIARHFNKGFYNNIITVFLAYQLKGKHKRGGE